MKQVSVLINEETYILKLADTQAAQELFNQLPLNLVLDDFNQNEKVESLRTKYPTAAEDVGYINKGDVMLYGNENLVMFYKSFPTSYSYTRLGHLENADNLAERIGPGSITVEITQSP